MAMKESSRSPVKQSPCEVMQARCRHPMVTELHAKYLDDVRDVGAKQLEARHLADGVDVPRAIQGISVGPSKC